MNSPAGLVCQTDLGFGGPPASHPALSVCGGPVTFGNTFEIFLSLGHCQNLGFSLG